jgi:hypothetical protein
MSPLRPHLIAALHLSGTSARTQASSVREGRLRVQFSHQSPDRMTEQSCSALPCTGKPSTASPQPPCASAPAASASSLTTASHALGTRWRSCARTRHPGSPPSAGERRAGGSFRRPLPCPTRSPAPPSLAWASASMQPSSCQSPIALGSASRALSPVARAPQIAPSPCPPRPARCSAAPGQPLVTPPGFCPPLGGSPPTVLRRPSLGVAPGCREPSAKRNTGPGSPTWASLSLP